MENSTLQLMGTETSTGHGDSNFCLALDQHNNLNVAENHFSSLLGHERF